jgi:L-ascorbate metabolism protein UlaG (beta-lactamase superfamily)
MRMLRRACLAFLLLLPAALAQACGVSAEWQRPSPHIMRASTGTDEGLNIRFLGHASFLLTTPGGVTVVTDYSGTHDPGLVPDIVTMNHAHSTHFTDFPDPRIAHVLHGWSDDGGPAKIDLKLRDLHIRNLPTNIRNWNGGTEPYGNSIFVFETAGLCVAHLGHLHHLLTPDDLADLGQIDVVMAPIDGMWTSSQGDMIAVLAQMKPRLILPMHYFGPDILNRFLAQVRGQYAIRTEPRGEITLTRATLPEEPMVLVLPGPYF